MSLSLTSAYQYRLWPTKGQQRLLGEMLETCRWVYNETVATRKRAVHQCPQCGLAIDRDLNAGYTILRRGLPSQGHAPQEAPRREPGE